MFAQSEITPTDTTQVVLRRTNTPHPREFRRSLPIVNHSSDILTSVSSSIDSREERQRKVTFRLSVRDTCIYLAPLKTSSSDPQLFPQDLQDLIKKTTELTSYLSPKNLITLNYTELAEILPKTLQQASEHINDFLEQHKEPSNSCFKRTRHKKLISFKKTIEPIIIRSPILLTNDIAYKKIQNIINKIPTDRYISLLGSLAACILNNDLFTHQGAFRLSGNEQLISLPELKLYLLCKTNSVTDDATEEILAKNLPIGANNTILTIFKRVLTRIERSVIKRKPPKISLSNPSGRYSSHQERRIINKLSSQQYAFSKITLLIEKILETQSVDQLSKAFPHITPIIGEIQRKGAKKE